ncbi:MAG: HDOD domain-containing protein, partial [Gammaproteobacteria bacterium]|nr:HDOD domain-containing protein [Gammaproteobacteria bacterium]
PATARAAGLLHNLGLLWIVDQLPQQVEEVIKRVERNQNITFQQALSETLGFDQAQAGGHLASCWKLPDLLVTAMAHYLQYDYQDCHEDIVLTTGLAAELVSASLNEASCPDSDPRIARLEISGEDISTLYSQLGGLVTDTRAIAKILI